MQQTSFIFLFNHTIERNDKSNYWTILLQYELWQIIKNLLQLSRIIKK